MTRKLLPLLGGFLCLSYSSIVIGQNPAAGTHELTGPVRVLWEARYDGPYHEQVQSIAVSPDGHLVLVTGFSEQLPFSRASSDFATIAYDAATGEQIWMSLYDGPAAAADYAQAVAVSPHGNAVFVTGVSTGVGTQEDCATLAYDATTGDQIWAARYDGPASGRDYRCALAVSPDGGAVFVAADSEDHWTGSDYAVIAYDAATGAEIWVARYDGPASLSDHVGQVAVSPSGGEVFVSGGSPCSQCNTDCATAAYDATTGEELWVARYRGPGLIMRSHCGHTAVSRDGGTVFVGGWSDELGSGSDYVVVAYGAATGEELWTARYDGPALASDSLQSMRASPDGGLVVATGDSQGNEWDTDFATVAYDATTGDEEWVARHGGPDRTWDSAKSVVALPDGGLVVATGYTYRLDTGGDYLTVAYDSATGEEIWVARYDGLAPVLASDAAVEVSARPDGRVVYVTGNSEGHGTGHDYTTVAYCVVLPIEIDIKPENDTNPIDPRSHGVTPVALLGSGEFDVTEVDVATLRFGPGEAAPAHDLTAGWPYGDPLRDVNRDGHADLLVHFSTQETGIQCGDTEVTLTGQLMDRFPIEGADSIRTVGCSHKAQSQNGQE